MFSSTHSLGHNIIRTVKVRSQQFHTRASNCDRQPFHARGKPIPKDFISNSAELLVTNDVKVLYENIQQVVPKRPLSFFVIYDDGLPDNTLKELGKTHPKLKLISQYYFDGHGKAIRPVIVLCLAKAINLHMKANFSEIAPKQRKVAEIVEMIHTASLIHDDVIDRADRRRMKPSINTLWGPKKSILAGTFIVATANMMIAKLNNDQVASLLFQALEDMVKGELMQVGINREDCAGFSDYLNKTYFKTGSLIANGCHAVSVFAGAGPNLQRTAFRFGRETGMGFQLVDDLLDYTMTAADLGKPVTADLRLGLATAPALFAAEQFPELRLMLKRRFTGAGDVERALQLVAQSDGLLRTKQLAKQYFDQAVGQLTFIVPSTYQYALINFIQKLQQRIE